MADKGFPLYALLDEINAAASGGAPLLAVAMCVALPDICASLISADGRTDSGRYKAWCKDNLGPEFSYVSPDDLYSMRCGVLHNGRFGDMKNDIARVIFMVGSNSIFTNGKLNDAYFYSAAEFCKNFTHAVYKWIEANKGDANVVANAPRLMQYHPNGISPYVVGAKVLG